MPKQIKQLVQQVGVQRFEDQAQIFRGGKHSLYCSPLSLESGIRAGKMIADQFLKAAMVELIGNLLKRRDVLLHLIELSAHTLAVLGNESRNAASRNGGCNQDKTVKHSTNKIHGYPGDIEEVGLTAIAQAGRYTVNGQMDRPFHQHIVVTRAIALQQRNLQVIQRVDIRRAGQQTAGKCGVVLQ